MVQCSQVLLQASLLASWYNMTETEGDSMNNTSTETEERKKDI